MSWLQTLAGAQNSEEIQNPIRQNANGTWYVPETFEAGNRWSSANVNKDWATQFGGTYNAAKPTYSAVSNPYNPNYAGGTGKALDFGSDIGGWTFNQDPTQAISSGQGATFIPGQGQSKLGSAVKSIAPIAGIAAAPFLAAGLAGMAGGQGFMGGISGMSGMGGAGAGAGFSSGAGLGTIPAVGNAPAIGAAGAGAAGAGAAGAGTAAAGASSGGGLLSGSIPSMAGVPTMAGNGIGAAGGTGFGAGGLTAAGTGAATAGSGGIGSWLSGVGDKLGSQLTNNPLGAISGVGQGIMQYLQGQNLQDIASTASNKANALNDPQRKAYQQLLGQYYFGGQDITQQPMYKAAMQLSTDQNQAKLAAQGLNGGGRAITSANENMANIFNSTAQPYLNSLSGIAGYGFGPGSSGEIYGNLNSAASGANTQALGSIVNGLTAPTASETPWYQHANYAQNQMTQVPGAGTYNPSLGK